MANRTVKDAKTIHGTNPQYLVEKIIRARIYESRYWKEYCFAVNAELLVDRASELRYIGGVFGGNIKPTPFLCLILKMLQIQPDKEIIIELIKQDDFKYTRALGAFYLRLIAPAVECYRYLEPLYNDFRKLRTMDRNGAFSLTHMDEFVDDLLHAERACDILLPRLAVRSHLEASGDLEPRVSALDEDLDAAARAAEKTEDSDGELPDEPAKVDISSRSRKEHRKRSRSRSHSPLKNTSKSSCARARSPLPFAAPPSRERSRRENPPRRSSRSRSRSRSRGRDRGDRDRDRERDRERERDRRDRQRR